jgi:SAM-dependent methyltransferase
MRAPSQCPLTGAEGREIRRRSPQELAESYSLYCGGPLPPHIVEKYFTDVSIEYFSPVSGLRWYTPPVLGDGDYYATLAAIYSWYYNPGSWDKQVALELIGNRPGKIVEIGSGSGWFLSRLRERKMQAIGVEINPKAVETCRAEGLSVFFPAEVPRDIVPVDFLCLFQTIEHVSDPIGFLQQYVEQFHPRQILLSAPCFESLLGHTKDPLSWPPHHVTAWSEKAFQTLAGKLHLRVVDTRYSPLSLGEFESRLEREGSRKLHGLPYFPTGRLGRWMFGAARRAGCDWACRGHSILSVLNPIEPL